MKRPILLVIVCLSFLSLHAQNDSVQVNEELGCTFSFPWVNNYRFVDYEKGRMGKKSGFFGVGGGIFYRKTNYKISLNFNFTEDLSSPIGLIDYSSEGSRTSISTTFGELSWHKRIKSGFHGILGINLSNYRYEYLSNDQDSYSLRKTDRTLGLTAGLEYRFNKFLSVATIYRPALASFETDENYRHTISLDIRVDVVVNRMEKNYFR